MSEMWFETERLAADLADAPLRLAADIVPVVSRGALNIKNDWRDRLSGLPHLPHLPDAITYDLDVKLGRISAEVGPDKSRRQGPLGSIAEFGSVNNPPRLDGQHALDAETPKYFAAVEAVAQNALLSDD